MRTAEPQTDFGVDALSQSHCPVFAVNDGRKDFALDVVHKIDVGIGVQCPEDAAARAPVFHQIGRKRGQNTVAGLAYPAPNHCGVEAVGELSRAAYLQTVFKKKQLDGVFDKIIAVEQGIGEQLGEHHFGYFGHADAVKVLPALYFIEFGKHKIEALSKLLVERAVQVFAAAVLVRGEVVAPKSNRRDVAVWRQPLRMLAEQERAREVELVGLSQVEVMEVLAKQFALAGFFVLGLKERAEFLPVQVGECTFLEDVLFGTEVAAAAARIGKRDHLLSHEGRIGYTFLNPQRCGFAATNEFE